MSAGATPQKPYVTIPQQFYDELFLSMSAVLPLADGRADMPAGEDTAITHGLRDIRNHKGPLMTSTFRSCLLASTMLVAGMATPAFAQQQTVPEAEKPAEAATEIVVTGSRISRPDLELASPVNVISQQEIQFRQPGTADDLLRNLSDQGGAASFSRSRSPRAHH